MFLDHDLRFQSTSGSERGTLTGLGPGNSCGLSVYSTHSLPSLLLPTQLQHPAGKRTEIAMGVIKLGSIAAPTVVTLSSSDTVADAVHAMKTRNIKNVIVVDGDNYRLFLSSMLPRLERREFDFETPLADLDLPVATTLTPEASVLEGLRAIGHRGEHICLVDAGGDPCGVLGYSDLAATPDPEMAAQTGRLRDLVLRNTIPELERDAPLQEGMRRMDAEGHDAAVIVDADAPVGILTYRDIIDLMDRRTDTATPVEHCMTQPLETLSEGASIADALSFCRDKGIKRVVVVDDRGRLSGVISRTELVDYYHNIWFKLFAEHRADLNRLNNGEAGEPYQPRETQLVREDILNRTEETQARRQLTETEERSRFVLEATEQGVWDWDAADARTPGTRGRQQSRRMEEPRTPG
jgi:CBS domain-containing protein